MLSSQKTGSISEKQDDATTEIENWERSMEKEQQRVAKGRVVALMQAGHSWQEASTMAGVQISRSAAYRLLQKVRTQGEAGLQDGRHGHPAKLREPVQQWLKDYCHAAPGTPSHIVQQALANRFGT